MPGWDKGTEAGVRGRGHGAGMTEIISDGQKEETEKNDKTKKEEALVLLCYFKKQKTLKNVFRNICQSLNKKKSVTLLMCDTKSAGATRLM